MAIFPVIMAGGSGTRFWPLSRRNKPKQFLALVTEQSLITETATRLAPLASVEDCYVVCGKLHGPAVKRALPALPKAHILVEPAPRNTAPCIGLAALVVAQSHPEGILAVLPSDHHIRNGKAFREALAEGAQLAQRGELVTLGIKPHRPETGYGYIKVGAQLAGGPAHAVAAFVEKPDLARAQAYLAEGNYLWNAGIFLFRADAILGEIQKHIPELWKGLQSLAPHVGKKTWTAELAEVFPKMPSVSIDYGVMEKASKIAVIPADFGWSDVGSFSALPEVKPLDADGNVLQGMAMAIGSKNCVVLGRDRPVAVIGVEDLVVVDAGDAILVCPRDKAQDVRKAVEQLEKLGHHRFL